MFTLVDPEGNIVNTWDILPKDRPITCKKYTVVYTGNQPRVQLITKIFRCDVLSLTKEEIPDKEFLNNFFTREATMANAQEIIDVAKTGDVAKTEEALQSAIGQAIKRALWLAEKKDEFTAIPVLQDLSVKYGGSVRKTDVAPKDGKQVLLAKDAKVDDRVWQAILKKASKLGAVLSSSATKATISISKKELESFTAAAKAVVGISVTAVA